MGAREAGNPNARDWAEEASQRAGSYAEATDFAEIVFFAVNGAALLAAAANDTTNTEDKINTRSQEGSSVE
ncbi:MAG: hypothetical protein GY798_18610 [Hyphomicrobiales bacterium]|nr:hypothetical protein [Hyphomicrobiales bacterium]